MFTSKAAKQGNLEESAILIKTYSFELNEDHLSEIAMADPNIFLLCGGTDGGDTEYIAHNVKMLASIQHDLPIVYAGKRSGSKDCVKILPDANVTIFQNAMTRLEEQNIDSAQVNIREVFMTNIVWTWSRREPASYSNK
ncbi:MAG: glutamate mutase L [Eggerthellaceae bacterium]|nr:glutamate mutase L [Eggerthellaceae bacterium]